MTGASIPGIIVSKLRYWWKPGLVILFEVDKCSKVGFYSAILPLGLTVCLMVERGWEPPFDSKKVIKQWLEFRGKKQASIGYD